MLVRRAQPRRLISLTPLVDVFLILLVFFMVTSTYLDLNMIPAITPDDETATSSGSGSSGDESSVLIRIGADGQAVLRGRTMSPDDLIEALRARSGSIGAQNIILLPSTRATMQSLVTMVDALTRAGAGSVRVMQLEAEP